MQIKNWLLAAAACSALIACGDNIGEQVLAGGVTGGAVSAVAGGNVGTGALVGAAGNVAYCQTYPERC